MNNLIQFFIWNKQFLNFSYFLTEKKLTKEMRKNIRKWKEQKQSKFLQKIVRQIDFLAGD